MNLTRYQLVHDVYQIIIHYRGFGGGGDGTGGFGGGGDGGVGVVCACVTVGSVQVDVQEWANIQKDFNTYI